MGRKKIEYTEEERKERNRLRVQKWRKNNPEKEKILRDKNNERRRGKRRVGNPLFLRASNLLSAYNQSDRKHNRGKGDLTTRWIVENIFTQPCKYCGKTGWDVIGCNRIDNELPHTIDNVEPCCAECNKKLPKKYV